MRTTRTRWRWLALLPVLFACGLAAAQGATQETPGVVIGGSYTLASGQTLRGDLVAIGASVVVEPDATLDGHFTAVGGSTVIDGLVTGNVHAYGGALALGDGARVRGDVSALYAAYTPAPGAVVDGSVEGGNEPPVLFSLPADVRAPADVAVRVAAPRTPVDGLLRALGIGVLAMLVMAALPQRLGRVRDTMLRVPVRAGFDGLLSFLVILVVLVLLAVTIIGIPLAVLGGTLLYATVLFGWIAFGDAIGTYLERAFKQSWNPPLRAGIGAFSLSLALLILGVVPPLAGLIGVVLALVGLGAVRMTRFGGRDRQYRRPEGPSTPVAQG